MATLKVLVVDDEPGIRSGIERILRNFKVDYPFMDENYDFEVIEAGTGEDAIEIINSNIPDIALLDNKLPGIQGIEVLEYIKNNNLDIVVVMITSYASIDVAVKATNDGAIDFIPKPFTPQELKSSLENITKQLFLKRMARQMKDQGKQVRFQFLSVLSHELKAPLNAVEGYLQIIKDRQLGTTLEDYDQLVERSINRIHGMRHLILNLLDLTKIESGKPSQKIQNTNLTDVMRSSIDIMMPFAIQKEVEISLNAPEKLNKYIDPEEMEIVFNNLISNAIKYNTPGGKVDLTITEEGGKTIVVVEDTGIGISAEDQQSLFKDFVRIKNPKTRNIIGSGLGLSIVKKIVDMNNGEITMESATDKGTKFTLKFPF